MPTETHPLPDAPLATLVSVQRRFLRSVNLERDFYSPAPLDGYLQTASAANIAQEVIRTNANW